MPLFGTLELPAVTAVLPTLRDLDTEPWSLPKAEILQMAFEAPRDTHALLPKALHPAIPSYVTIVVTRFPESPVGPFLLAQLRLMARAGAHPRGFILRAYASTPEAAVANDSSHAPAKARGAARRSAAAIATTTVRSWRGAAAG